MYKIFYLKIKKMPGFSEEIDIILNKMNINIIAFLLYINIREQRNLLYLKHRWAPPSSPFLLI